MPCRGEKRPFRRNKKGRKFPASLPAPKKIKKIGKSIDNHVISWYNHNIRRYRGELREGGYRYAGTGWRTKRQRIGWTLRSRTGRTGREFWRSVDGMEAKTALWQTAFWGQTAPQTVLWRMLPMGMRLLPADHRCCGACNPRRSPVRIFAIKNICTLPKRCADVFEKKLDKTRKMRYNKVDKNRRSEK